MSFGQTCVRVFCAVVLLLLSPPLSRADVVKLTARPAFRNVSIRDFSGDSLLFRGVSQQYLRKPFQEVEWIQTDQSPALSNAEQARHRGEWTIAARGYEDALGQAESGWLRALIRVRLIEACDHAGEFAPAVTAWADLIATGPDAAVTASRPRHPGPPGSEANRQARDTLERALTGLERAAPPTATDTTTSRPSTQPVCTTADLVRTVLLELRIFDGLDDLPPPPGQITVRRPIQPTSAPASEPEIGILPDAPEPATSQPVHPGPAPRLHADSLLLAAAEAALAAGDAPRALRLVDRGLPYVPAAERDPWQLMRGRARIESGQAAPAAADLLTLATRTENPAVAARALYYVGWAHERLGQPDVAERLYREVLARQAPPEDAREKAAAGLERVKAKER